MKGKAAKENKKGGFCWGLFRRLFEATFMFCLITFCPGLPPDMEFSAYSLTEPRELEGPLAINDKLNRADRLEEGNVIGPEGFAVANKTLYTAVLGGDIKKLVGEKLVTVANVGGPCAGVWDAENCGRPLGMQFDRHGMLYVADAYHGIFKVNVNTGKSMHLIKTDEPIEGKMARITNSVAVSKDGSVYWSVSSCDVGLHDGVLTLLGGPSGRIFKYDQIKKTNTLVADKIHFSNGIVLSEKEDFLVVAETNMARLLRVWLKGPKQGQTEVFLDGLPGLPDNLRVNDEGNIFVPLVAPRHKSMPGPGDLLGPYPTIRRFFARLLCLLEMPFKTITRHFPNVYTGTVAHMINNFETALPILPKGLVVLEVSEKGEIVSSLQGTNGIVTGVSDIVFVDQTYYLGSPFNNYLGRVKTRIPIHVKVTAPPPEAAPKA